MSTLEATTTQPAVDHCAQCMHDTFGPIAGPALTVALFVAAGWAKQWVATRKLEAEKVRLKEERNSHAARAQELEVKVASLGPPPMPVLLNVPGVYMPSASVPPPPPRDLAGEPVDAELEHADTVPPRGRK
jgi:hypothetical protein